MNKTLNINLGGLIFHIDEDAYRTLEHYLSVLKRQFANTEGGDEIVRDVEVRIAELFREKTTKAKEVISSADVEEVIGILGKPEDYLDAEDETGAHRAYEEPVYTTRKRIFRDPDDRILGGVASGLAAYFNIDPLWMRILFVALIFAGFGILFYFILWLVVPKASTTAEKLQMRGESVNISNIERSIREEMGSVGENVKNFGKKASQYDYRKTTRNAGNSLREIGDFIIDALKLIFRFILKLIGFFFIFVGFIVLFALVAALFTGSFHLMGSDQGIYDLFEFFSLVTVNNSHYHLLLIGLGLLVLAPLTLIVYLGVRIIFKLERLGSPARNGLILAAVVGFVMLLVSGVRIATEFDDRSFYTTERELSVTTDRVELHLNKDDIYQVFEDYDFSTSWVQVEEGNAFTSVKFDIQASPDTIMRLKTTVEAWGSNRRIARNNAESVRYKSAEVADGLMLFSPYYLLPKGVPFRDQEVDVILYLPIGKSVYLGQDMADIIYDIQNVENYWDFDMIDHEWIMTERGLECADCLEARSFEEEEEVEAEQTDTVEEMSLQLSATPVSNPSSLSLTNPSLFITI